MRKKAEFLKQIVGRIETVLFEGQVEDGLRFGLTEQYVRVGVPRDEVEENSLVPVLIQRTTGENCAGTVATAKVCA
jgi:tRNA A37 methylthiotransferase MiaB